VRKELKFLMAVFLVLSALYVISWGLMFDSRTFRWTYYQWAFFGSIATISAVLVVADLIVGIICRLNFDKGLPNYCERITVPLFPLVLIN
jgi:predicted membrane protein